eukprot:779899-Lingulodinium_polyedra.AAC.1
MATETKACATASGTTCRCAVGSSNCQAVATSQASGNWWRKRGARREMPVAKKRYWYIASSRS